MIDCVCIPLPQVPPLTPRSTFAVNDCRVCCAFASVCLRRSLTLKVLWVLSGRGLFEKTPPPPMFFVFVFCMANSFAQLVQPVWGTRLNSVDGFMLIFCVDCLLVSQTNRKCNL